jgi:hypothetical protein
MGRASARLARHVPFGHLYPRMIMMVLASISTTSFAILLLFSLPSSLHLHATFRRFETGGSLGPTSECRRVPEPRWVEREGEREGGRARRPETGVREVGIPRPSCSSRTQVGCACSRGLQASTREREASGSKRAPVSSSSLRGQPSLRGPWSFLL